MKSEKKYFIITLILLFAFSLVSCKMPLDAVRQNSSTVEGTKGDIHGEITDKGPTKGGTLKLFSTVPDTLNPLLTDNTYVQEFLSFVYEGLVKLDEKQKAIPSLSDKWEVSSDGVTWTFHIRENVYWHDNIPLSADDVEFTFNTILKSNINSMYKVNVGNISTFASLDNHTFRIVTKYPNSFTPEMMVFPIIPKHCYVGSDIKDLKCHPNMRPVGTGPYKFISYSGTNGAIKLIPNNDWWNSQSSEKDDINPPYISEVLVKTFPDSTYEVSALQTKEVDAITIKNGLYNNYAGRNDLITRKYLDRKYDFITLNLDKPALSDIAVRQAIAYAVDRNKIIYDILPGEAIGSDLPLHTNCWIWENCVNKYAPNIAKSREILEKAGWRNYNGILYKNINGISTRLTFDILVNDNNKIRQKVAEKLKQQLEEAGFKINIKSLKWDDQIKQIRSRKFDLALVGCKISSIPDISFMYSSTQIAAGLNLSGYKNAQVDEYLIKILMENDQLNKKMLFLNLYDILQQEVPYIGLYFYNDAVVYNKKIRGNLAPGCWNKFSGIESCYIADW